MSDDQPHYHGHRQRLRDRFAKSGLAGFADAELLLTLAIPRSDVGQPAKALVLAATTVQIRVLDHLVVSTDAVFSFRKEGLL